MNRKRGEGLSLKRGKGWGFVLGGPPCAALERREFQKVTLSNLFYLSLEVGREKVNMMCVAFSNETKHFFVFIIRRAQSHTLTSMMGTTSALRRSNEQQFSALPLLYLFIIVVDPSGVTFVT